MLNTLHVNPLQINKEFATILYVQVEFFKKLHLQPPLNLIINKHSSQIEISNQTVCLT